jgi:hypothetical protein
MSRMSENLGTSTSDKPKGLHDLYRGNFNFIIVVIIIIIIIIIVKLIDIRVPAQNMHRFSPYGCPCNFCSPAIRASAANAVCKLTY